MSPGQLNDGIMPKQKWLRYRMITEPLKTDEAGYREKMNGGKACDRHT